MQSRFFDASKKPRLFGHRGASAYFPENTLPSFDAAAKAVPYLELDVWTTTDGSIVVHHDESLRRTCGVDRRVSDYSFAELKRLDAGYMYSNDGGKTFPFRGQGYVIPTLDEVLSTFSKSYFNIEIKQEHPGLEARVVDLIRSYHADDKVLLAAEKDSITGRIRAYAPEIPTGMAIGEGIAFMRWVLAGCPEGFRCQAKALQIPERYESYHLAHPKVIHGAHAQGVEVHFWTINAEADMRRLVELGADGIMSDDPELLAKVFLNHGL